MNHLAEKHTESSRAREVTRPFQHREYRSALSRFATGVNVITTRFDSHVHGMTANAFVSVALDPPLVLLSLDNRSRMHQILPSTLRFGVSVLGEDQEKLSNHFAGRTVNDLEVSFISRLDVPLVEGAIAHFVAEVVNRYPAGDHTLYIARVEHFEACDRRPLLFYGGRYEQLYDRPKGDEF
jgi:flavin reductase (DIM6/NTAB) family NADH-FMN oxidoreductase RutF